MFSFWKLRSRYERALLVVFILSMPFMHPRVDGDGIGYYAYLRSPLIDHNLRFASDWSNPSLLLTAYANRRLYVNPITKTGHLPNFYTVGPAMLWLPFVGAMHVGVLLADRMGAQIPPDGHSWPYLLALSGSTALYGFLGLCCSFLFARKYLEERWAFWATIGIWFASSLPVYIYLEPSWSHAHSAFCVALFLWYWDRTRGSRTLPQWAFLGLISGLMLDVYLPNGIFLLPAAFGCFSDYKASWDARRRLWVKIRSHLSFIAAAVLAFSPMLIARQIVYGSAFTSGMYGNIGWNWKSPAFRAVLFSHEHGLFLCTPVLLLAAIGLFAFCARRLQLGMVLASSAVAFYCLISFYPWWDGTVGFGNRFFISLTALFVLGLANLFSATARFLGDSNRAARRLIPITALLILWNLGLVYQWSQNLFPQVGPVYWKEVVYNQFHVVPPDAIHALSSRFLPKAQALDHTPKN
jgi:Dolichyl-phosphate-mannose-protein mannosyltransferase